MRKSDDHHLFYPWDVEIDVPCATAENGKITYKLSDLTVPITGDLHRAITFKQNMNNNGENLNKLIMMSIAINAEVIKMMAKIQFEHDNDGLKVPKRRKNDRS